MERHVTDFVDTRDLFAWRHPNDAAAGDTRRPFVKLSAWRKRRRTIRDLEALDDRMLADIGLSREQIRPFVDDLLNAGATGRSAANDNQAAIAA